MRAVVQRKSFRSLRLSPISALLPFYDRSNSPWKLSFLLYYPDRLEYTARREIGSFLDWCNRTCSIGSSESQTVQLSIQSSIYFRGCAQVEKMVRRQVFFFYRVRFIAGTRADHDRERL